MFWHFNDTVKHAFEYSLIVFSADFNYHILILIFVILVVVLNCEYIPYVSTTFKLEAVF